MLGRAAVAGRVALGLGGIGLGMLYIDRNTGTPEDRAAISAIRKQVNGIRKLVPPESRQEHLATLVVVANEGKGDEYLKDSAASTEALLAKRLASGRDQKAVDNLGKQFDKLDSHDKMLINLLACKPAAYADVLKGKEKDPKILGGACSAAQGEFKRQIGSR